MISKVAVPAIQGIQRSFDNVRKTAENIATQPVRGTKQATDLTRSLVSLRQQEHQTAANVKVLKAADQMLGSLLDVKA